MGLFDDDDQWNTIVPGSTDYARVQQLENHLLVVFPIGYIDHSTTRFTQPGKKSDVIVSDIIDLDDFDEQGNPGKVYRTAWWRSAQLIMTLRPLIGGKILGRISKGLPRNGMNPPWVINDATTEPGALDRAKAWGQAHVGFTISTFVPPTVAPQPQYQQQAQPQYQSQPQPQYQQQAQPQFQQQQHYQDPGQSYAHPSTGYQHQGQPQYQQQAQPQYQQPAVQQQQYQQPPQNYPQQQQYPQQQPQTPQFQQPPPQYQQPPSFQVQAGPPNGPDQLDLMRAERMRRESAPPSNENWQNQEPPF